MPGVRPFARDPGGGAVRGTASPSAVLGPGIVAGCAGVVSEIVLLMPCRIRSDACPAVTRDAILPSFGRVRNAWSAGGDQQCHAEQRRQDDGDQFSFHVLFSPRLRCEVEFSLVKREGCFVPSECFMDALLRVANPDVLTILAYRLTNLAMGNRAASAGGWAGHL